MSYAAEEEYAYQEEQRAMRAEHLQNLLKTATYTVSETLATAIDNAGWGCASDDDMWRIECAISIIERRGRKVVTPCA